MQFLLAGGWRAAVFLALAYLGAAGFISGLLYSRIPSSEHGQIHQSLLSLTGILQVVLLLTLGPSAIRKTVQRDFQTGMMESNRLTPLSGLRLVLGYLSGASAPLVALASVGLLIGVGYSAAHGRVIGYPGLMVAVWLYSNLCLFVLTAMIHSLSLLSALATSGKGQFVGILVAVGVIGGGFLVFAVPGLALVLGVMSVGQFLNVAGFLPLPAASDPSISGWAAISQLLFAIVFVDAAARKIRSPERALFNLPQGLVFLALSWGALVIGYQKLGALRIFGASLEDNPTQAIASLAAFQIAAVVPILAAADYRLLRDRIAVLRGSTTRVAMRIVDLMPLVSGLAGLSLLLLMPSGELAEAWETRRLALVASVFAACVLGAVTDYAWLYLTLARRWRVIAGLLIPAIAFKGLPFVAEGLLRFASVEANSFEPYTPWLVAAFSPLGLPAAALAGGPILPGLAVQLLVAAGSVWVAVAASRKRLGALADSGARSAVA